LRTACFTSSGVIEFVFEPGIVGLPFGSARPTQADDARAAETLDQRLDVCKNDLRRRSLTPALLDFC
jgi:hypothetical protein